MIFLFKVYFTDLKGRFRERKWETQRDISFTGSLPQQTKQSELGHSKTRSFNLLPGLPHECGATSTWTLFHCSPRLLAGNWMLSGVGRTETHPDGTPVPQAMALPTHYTTVPAPNVYFNSWVNCITSNQDKHIYLFKHLIFLYG